MKKLCAEIPSGFLLIKWVVNFAVMGVTIGLIREHKKNHDSIEVIDETTEDRI